MPNIENLSVFMAPPCELGSSKDSVPHNRVYHHTTSLFPYSAQDAEDSETEDTPSWLSARTAKVCSVYSTMHECIHTCVHTCIHTCIHIYIHTYMHACMHTYIRIYVCMYVCIYNTYSTIVVLHCEIQASDIH